MHRRMLVIEDSKEDFAAIMRALHRDGTSVQIIDGVDGLEAEELWQALGDGRGDGSVGILYNASGDAALQNMRRSVEGGQIGRLPQVILLDLNLPGTDGREILAELKQDELLKRIPVVVLTTSTNPRDVVDCYDKGAAGYCVKGGDRATFLETIDAIKQFWLRAAILPKRADGR